MEKIKTEEELLSYLEKILSKQEIIALMMNALDEMETYNGRSRFDCICLALGFEQIVNEKTGGWKYKSKSEKEIKEACQSYI